MDQGRIASGSESSEESIMPLASFDRNQPDLD
jgi:hypothetical protein